VSSRARRLLVEGVGEQAAVADVGEASFEASQGFSASRSTADWAGREPVAPNSQPSSGSRFEVRIVAALR